MEDFSTARTIFHGGDQLKVSSQLKSFWEEIERISNINEKWKHIADSIKYLLGYKSEYWLATANMLNKILNGKDENNIENWRNAVTKKEIEKWREEHVKVHFHKHFSPKEYFCKVHLGLTLQQANNYIYAAKNFKINGLTEQEVAIIGINKTISILKNDEKEKLIENIKKGNKIKILDIQKRNYYESIYGRIRKLKYPDKKNLWKLLEKDDEFKKIIHSEMAKIQNSPKKRT